MTSRPLRTTVIGSYPFPGWLEFASLNLSQFGPADVAEAQDDAVICAIHDQVAAGLDVITDGEQTRLDFNLSFYGYLQGIELEGASPRRFGPPAHDQRGKHKVVGELRAPRGLGAVEEFSRLKRLAPAGPTLKASVPGPFTLSGRLIPNDHYKKGKKGISPIYLRPTKKALATAARAIQSRTHSWRGIMPRVWRRSAICGLEIRPRLSH